MLITRVGGMECTATISCVSSGIHKVLPDGARLCCVSVMKHIVCCAVLCAPVQADLKAQIKLPIVDGGPVDAFCGYFDVTFGGSEQNPAGEWHRLSSTGCMQLVMIGWYQHTKQHQPGPDLFTVPCLLLCRAADENVKLSTAPDATGATHWGQQVRSTGQHPAQQQLPLMGLQTLSCACIQNSVSTWQAVVALPFPLQTSGCIMHVVHLVALFCILACRPVTWTHNNCTATRLSAPMPAGVHDAPAGRLCAQ